MAVTSVSGTRHPLQSVMVRFLVATVVGLLLFGGVIQGIRWVSFLQETAWCARMATWYESQARESKEQAARFQRKATESASAAEAESWSQKAEETARLAEQHAEKAEKARSLERQQSFRLLPSGI